MIEQWSVVCLGKFAEENSNQNSLVIYMIEQWSVVCLGKYAEENSNQNNFLFSGRRGECMLKEKIGKYK